MAKVIIQDLEPGQLLTIYLSEPEYEIDPEDGEPEEIPEEQKPRRVNLIGMPKKEAV